MTGGDNEKPKAVFCVFSHGEKANEAGRVRERLRCNELLLFS